jgi:hypothetical protein
MLDRLRERELAIRGRHSRGAASILREDPPLYRAKPESVRSSKSGNGETQESSNAKDDLAMAKRSRTLAARRASASLDGWWGPLRRARGNARGALPGPSRSGAIL